MKIFLTQKTINDHKEKYNPGNEADLIDMFFREMKENESTIFTGNNQVQYISFILE